MRFLLLSLLLVSPELFAAGAFEKPVLWSARASQRAGAYSAEVKGAEALVFNPAGLIQAEKNEMSFGAAVVQTTYKAALVQDDVEKTNTPAPVTPVAFTYARQLDSKNAIGAGLYASGGINVGYDDVNLTGLGSDFTNFRPDIYAKLNMLELGFGYAHQFNDNLTLGGAIRADYIFGEFNEVQVLKSGGTVLGVAEGGFDNIKGYGLPALLLGAKYLTDDKKNGFGLTYRMKMTYKMRSEFQGNIVYSAAGSGAITGGMATPGQVYKLDGTHSDLETSLPQAATASYFRRLNENNTFYFEYTWTQYSDNRVLKIDGKMPQGPTNVAIPDHIFKWHDMHDFKIALTNTSIEKWILGGGYSFTLPVTDKDNAGATNAPPGNYHHFYFGAGRMFTNFRIDGALEHYFSEGDGKSTALPNIPAIQGTSAASAYAVSLSSSFYF